MHNIDYGRTQASDFPPKRALPPLIGARIEANSDYATLDELGLYRLRHLFAPRINPHTRASVPIRKQSPHDGPITFEQNGLGVRVREDGIVA